MEKCPKCGYGEGRDWPYLLLLLAFGLVVFVAATSGATKSVELSIGVGMFLFAASLFWRQAREDKNRVEYLKSHPGTEAPKKI